MLNNIWLDKILAPLNIMKTVFEIASSKYAIIGYFVLLIVVIAVLVIFVLANDSKETTAKTANVVFKNGESAPIVQTTTANTVKKVVAEEEERAPRFCMLSRIDENKRNYDARRFVEETSLKRFCDFIAFLCFM